MGGVQGRDEDSPSVIRRKGIKLDGSSPARSTGYGGFNVSLAPNFDPNLRLWLDGGGVYVVANLRGGGEYGEEWHRLGALTCKQNVFDDFIAAARYLIDQRYTTPERLAIIGGSNGGLLMGASFTQHPELLRAVVSQVGIYDMLRVELDPNGTFNTTEFGSVKDTDQFQALYAYSPYHHVVDGNDIPPDLYGDRRERRPCQSEQFAKDDRPPAGGHQFESPSAPTHQLQHGRYINSSLDEQVEEGADVWAFLFDQLGLAMDAPKPTYPPADTRAARPDRDSGVRQWPPGWAVSSVVLEALRIARGTA